MRKAELRPIPSSWGHRPASRTRTGDQASQSGLSELLAATARSRGRAIADTVRQQRSIIDGQRVVR